jgi:hypothetical protein
VPARTTRALTASESAWLAALPCALLLLALLLALGPPLGRALFKPLPEDTFWFEYLRIQVVSPEPTEQARYLLALLGPLLVSGGALLLAGRRIGSALVGPLVTLAQAVLAAFTAAALIAQQQHVYPTIYTSDEPAKTVYFTPVTLIVAAAIVALAVLALQHRPTLARLDAALRETRGRRVAAIALAALYVLLWLLSAFNTDGSLPNVNAAVAVNIPFWIDEAFSIRGGHAPLVDFHAQYGHLWAYIAAGGMALLGTSFTAYAAIMLAGTAGAMAAVYATLRRLAGSSLTALALFLPFVATSFFMQRGPLENRYGPANLFSVFPIRYAGPLLLLWLVVRRIATPSSRPPLLLFALAGLVAINNLEFGIPALGATIAALVWSGESRSRAGLLRLAGAVLGGLALAVAAVCVLTLAVAGSLPHFGMLLTFPRIYGKGAFGVLPMPRLGFHLVLYVTFAAAIVVATVRAASPASAGPRSGAALTGALAWSGVFGLGAGGYFVGRSHPHVLINLFSAWALALALLLLVVVPAVLQRGSRRPRLAELLVLAGFALCVCSLAQTPAPWSQVSRLQDVPPYQRRYSTAVLNVVRQLTHRGETVALFMKEGHRIADKLELDDVTPYANIESMMTRKQWQETIDALRRAHGRKIILVRETLFDEEVRFVQRSGFVGKREAHQLRLIEFVAREGGRGR